MKNKHKIITIITLLCAFAVHTNNYSQNQKRIDSIWQELTSIRSPKTDLYIELSGQYLYSDPKKAEYFVEQALLLIRKNKDSVRLPDAYKLLGNISFMKGDFESALKYYKKARPIYLKNNDSINYAKAVHNSGVAYVRLGYHNKSLDFNLQALEIFRQKKDSFWIAASYCNITEIYVYQKNLSKAKEYIEMILNIVKNDPKYDQLKAETYISYARYHHHRQQPDSSMYYAKNALKIYQELKLPSEIITSKSEISKYFFSDQKYNAALDLAKEAYDFAIQTNSKSKIGEYAYYLGNIYLAIGELTKSKKFYTEALQSSEETGALLLQEQALLGMAKYYEAVNDYKSAFQFRTQYEIIKDSAVTREVENRIASLETKLKSSEFTKKIAEQKEEIAKKSEMEAIRDLQIQRNKSWTIAIATFFLITGILLAWKFNINRIRQKNRLERELLTTRENIAKDFHDDLGNKLARITLLSNLLQEKTKIIEPAIQNKLSQIKADSEDLYQGTRDFMWSLKTDSDYLEELITYISDFGENYLSELDIEFTIIKDIEENCKLPYYWSRQLILIFKESLTNAVKHSQCTVIKIMFTYRNSFLEIELMDNGKGFDVCSTNGKNGLQHIQNRAKQIGGELIILSDKNGTSVKFIGKTTSIG